MLNKVPIQPLSTNSLREQARTVIRARIITGQIEQGRIYSAPTLAEELGVSATPVREAMLDLASEGLVQAVRNTGFRVAVLTDKDLDEILELRQMLEVPAMEALVGRLTPGRLKYFGKLANKIEQAALTGDLTEFVSDDRDFHMGLLREHSNGRLVDIIGRLRDQARLTGLPRLAHPHSRYPASRRERFIASAKEHGAIVRALSDRRSREVGQIISRHLVHSRGLWAGREEPDS